MQAIIPQADPEWVVDEGSPTTSSASYRVYNIGNNTPVKLMEYISALEQVLGITACKIMLSMQDGNVVDAHANISKIYNAIGFEPETSMQDGVKRFVNWYREFYKFQ